MQSLHVTKSHIWTSDGCCYATYLTGLHGSGTKMLLSIFPINGTVLCTVSLHPLFPQLASLASCLSLRSPNCQRWCTVFSLPTWVNQAPTPSITYLRASSPLRQWVSHSRRFPGWRVYVRSSKMPPSDRGGDVGQKENSCIKSWVLRLSSCGSVFE